MLQNLPLGVIAGCTAVAQMTFEPLGPAATNAEPEVSVAQRAIVGASSKRADWRNCGRGTREALTTGRAVI